MNRFENSSNSLNPNYIFLTHHAIKDFFKSTDKPKPKFLGVQDLTEKQRFGLQRTLRKVFSERNYNIKKVHNMLDEESKTFLSNMVKKVKHVDNHVEIEMFSGRNIIKFAFTLEEFEAICA